MSRSQEVSSKRNHSSKPVGTEDLKSAVMKAGRLTASQDPEILKEWFDYREDRKRNRDVPVSDAQQVYRGNIRRYLRFLSASNVDRSNVDSNIEPQRLLLENPGEKFHSYLESLPDESVSRMRTVARSTIVGFYRWAKDVGYSDFEVDKATYLKRPTQKHYVLALEQKWLDAETGADDQPLGENIAAQWRLEFKRLISHVAEHHFKKELTSFDLKVESEALERLEASKPGAGRPSRYKTLTEVICLDTKRCITSFKETNDGELSSDQRKRTYFVLRKFLSWAESQNLVEANSASLLRSRLTIKKASPKEVAARVKATEKEKAKPSKGKKIEAKASAAPQKKSSSNKPQTAKATESKKTVAKPKAEKPRREVGPSGIRVTTEDAKIKIPKIPTNFKIFHSVQSKFQESFLEARDSCLTFLIQKSGYSLDSLASATRSAYLIKLSGPTLTLDGKSHALSNDEVKKLRSYLEEVTRNKLTNPASSTETTPLFFAANGAPLLRDHMLTTKKDSIKFAFLRNALADSFIRELKVPFTVIHKLRMKHLSIGTDGVTIGSGAKSISCSSPKLIQDTKSYLETMRIILGFHPLDSSSRENFFFAAIDGGRLTEDE